MLKVQCICGDNKSATHIRLKGLSENPLPTPLAGSVCYTKYTDMSDIQNSLNGIPLALQK